MRQTTLVLKPEDREQLQLFRSKGLHPAREVNRAHILLALDRYFNTYEAQTPDFVARIWLGDTCVGENIYRGRTSEQHETAIPMDYLAASLPSGVAAVTGRTWSWAKRDPGAFVTAWAFATHRQTLLWSRWTGVLSCSAATKESTAWRM